MNEQLTSSSCPIENQSGNKASCPVSDLANGFDPFDQPFQTDPAQALIWAREQNPVFYAPKMGYWIVSRYEDVKAVFRDNILFSPSIALEKIVPFSQDAMDILASYDYQLNRTMVNEDEPVHTERRRALMEHFLPENLKARESMVRKLTTEYIDQFIDKGKVDLVEEMIWEIPLSVALNFLGVPKEDVDTLREFCTAHMVNTWGKPTPEEQEHVAHSVGKFWQYSGKVLEKMRREEDGEGWMHYAIRKQKEVPDVVTDSYLHSMMMAIIVAAHETTSHGTANALKMLLSNREVWQAIIDNPALIPNAVEECLRISGSAIAWRRKTTGKAVVGGVEIPEGEKLLIVMASANQDDRHFEHPEILDIYRENAVDHLTFGYGSHQCMGKNLARMEIRIFLEELTRRLPHMKLVDDQEFTYLPNISFRGPNSLWVEWDPEQNPERQPDLELPERQEFIIGPPQKSDITRTYVVDEIRDIAPDIKSIRLKDPSGNPIPKWSAGAHIDLLFENYSRKYSLCGNNDGYLEIAVLKESEGRGGSVYIHEQLAKGDIIKIRGPKNHFRLTNNDQHKILIAGGIGITPILAMADQLKLDGTSYEIHYCCKSEKHMCFNERLKREHGDQLNTYFKESGERLDLATLVSNLPTQSQIYACGPERMLDELQHLTSDLPASTLNIEYFNPVENNLDPEVEDPFKVYLRDTGIDLEVPADKTLLQVLQNQGIDLPYDCSEGLCGSCEVQVHEGDIDHRDKVLSTEEKSGNHKMMACCSRAMKGGKLTIGL